MIIHNLGINFAGGGGGGEAVLTAATFTDNNTYTPEQGVDGFSAVTVNVDLTAPFNSGYTSGVTDGYASGYTSGYTSGETDGIAEQKALLSSTTIYENGTYTSENGFSAVTVNTPSAGENKLQMLASNQLTAVTQSDLSGATNVKDYFFYGNSNLKSVDLPSTVKTLNNGAFKNSGIESIDVSNITTYGNEVFNGCKNLTGITGFENYTGESRTSFFAGCSALTGNLSTSMKFLPSTTNMFDGCKNLKSITWLRNQSDATPSNSWQSMYSDCTSMEYLDYTHNVIVANLGSTNKFTAFTQNYEIRVPDFLYDAWTAATNWNNASIVGHIKAYPSQTGKPKRLVYNTSSGNTINSPGSALTSWSYVISSGDTTIKDYSYEYLLYAPDDMPIQCIGGYSKATNVTKLYLQGFKSINDMTLGYMSNLRELEFSQEMSLIGFHSMLFTSSLTKITFHSTEPPTWDREVIASTLSSNCKLYVPKGCAETYTTWKANTELKNCPVYEFDEYMSATLTTSEADESKKIVYNNDFSYVDSIYVDGTQIYDTDVDANGNYTFANAGAHRIIVYLTGATTTQMFRGTEIESLYLSEGVVEISNDALATCTTLSNINIGNAEIIGARALSNCTSLTTGITSNYGVGKKALSGVKRFTNKTFQFSTNFTGDYDLDAVEYIDNNVFRSTQVTGVKVGPNVTTMNYNVFNNDNVLSALTFDSAITGLTELPSVGDNTYALTEVVFPDSITTYGQSGNYAVFTSSSALTSVTFGSGATSFIGPIFMGDMPSLTSITCKATVAPSIVTGCFDAVTGNTGTLYVPAGSDYSTWAAELGSNWTVSDTL